MRKLGYIAAVALLGAGSLAGCSTGDGADAGGAGDCTPAHPDLETVVDGTLTVATYTLPPFLVAEGKELKGLEGEILGAVAEMECLDLVGQPLDSGSVVQSVQNGRTDMAAGNWYCTAARAEVLNLAGPVYGDQLAVVSTSGADSISELLEEDLVVGMPDGYNWMAEFKEIFGDNLRIFPNPTAMYEDMKAGRIDALSDSFGSATYANEQNGGAWDVEVLEPDERVATSVEPGQVCFPIGKDNESLLEAVNADVETLRESGELAKMLENAGLDPSAAEPGELRLP